MVKPKRTPLVSGLPDACAKNTIRPLAGKVTDPASVHDVLAPPIVQPSDVVVAAPLGFDVLSTMVRESPVPGAVSRETDKLAAVTCTAGVLTATGSAVAALTATL